MKKRPESHEFIPDGWPPGGYGHGWHCIRAFRFLAFVAVAWVVIETVLVVVRALNSVPVLLP